MLTRSHAVLSFGLLVAGRLRRPHLFRMNEGPVTTRDGRCVTGQFGARMRRAQARECEDSRVAVMAVGFMALPWDSGACPAPGTVGLLTTRGVQDGGPHLPVGPEGGRHAW
jgi:hypothetical protein